MDDLDSVVTPLSQHHCVDVEINSELPCHIPMLLFISSSDSEITLVRDVLTLQERAMGQT